MKCCLDQLRADLTLPRSAQWSFVEVVVASGTVGMAAVQMPYFVARVGPWHFRLAVFEPALVLAHLLLEATVLLCVLLPTS